MRTALTTCLLFSCLWTSAIDAQVTAETTSKPIAVKYPARWPASPSRDSVPAWAAPGRIRFARWDGGRLETAKGMLSGWPGFNPPNPDWVDTMTNWYRPETVRFLREAAVNLIWVTFSNGFSIETEAGNQRQLRDYIEECHRAGIRVMAYESITNIFWEDMYERVPESRDWVSRDSNGKPRPYGGGDYTKMGRVTRYLADVSHPGWRDYLRRRIDLAIDAGADGVMFDNNATEHLLEAYQELYRHGANRKKDFLLMGNFHSRTYVYNRLINSITTEDAFEPGIYAEANATRLNFNQERYYGKAYGLVGNGYGLLPVEGGLLVNNVGLYRVHQALSEGWKPTMIENGPREGEGRETSVISAGRHQLALAECQMFGISMELYVEGPFAHGLQTGDPAMKLIWEAAGKYNRFFAENEMYYTNMRTIAPLAIVLDDRSAIVTLLNGLAARHVDYDVIYEHDLTAEKLAPYSAVAVLTAATVRDAAVSAIEAFVNRGGKLFTAGDAATLDENGRPRPSPAFFSRGRYYEKLPAIDALAQELAAAAPSRLRLEAPPGVLANTLSQAENGQTRLVTHLLNYRPHGVQGVKVRLPGKFRNVRLLTPDKNKSALRLLPSTEKETVVEVPELEIYSLLVFESPQKP